MINHCRSITDSVQENAELILISYLAWKKWHIHGICCEHHKIDEIKGG